MFSYNVVIPTYNSSEYVIETIKSVQRQEIKPQNIIVIDDMSNDFTLLCDKINKLNISNLLIERVKEKGNAAISRNIGWEYSNSVDYYADYVFFLDSDDVWLDCHVSNYRCIFERSAKVEVLFGSFYTKHLNSCVLSDSTDMFSVLDNPIVFLMSEAGDFRTSTLAVKSNLKTRFSYDSFKHQDWDLFCKFHERKNVISYSSIPSVNIVIDSQNRMSSRNNLDASFLFHQRWFHFFTNKENVFFGYMLFRSACINKNTNELKRVMIWFKKNNVKHRTILKPIFLLASCMPNFFCYASILVKKVHILIFRSK